MIRSALLRLPLIVRRILLGLGDATTVVITLWIAFAIRFGEWWPLVLQEIPWIFPAALAIFLSTFVLVGLYRPILRYADESLLYTIVQGTTLGLLLLMALCIFLQNISIPRSSWIIFWLLLSALLGTGRLLLRTTLRRHIRPRAPRAPVIIYGAGEAGAQLVNALRYSGEFEPVVFVDDSAPLWGSVVHGLKVRAPSKLPRLMKQYNARHILLALPSASRQRRRDILHALAQWPVCVLDLPTLAELTTGVRRIDEFREIDVADLLGRDSVQPDLRLLQAPICEKSIMVTGAGGSIGAELCRQILALRPRQLVLFERSEYALYSIMRELSAMLGNMALGKDISLIPLLGSVIHKRRLQVVMERFSVQTVYHTAAYKHVSIVECNLIEGLQNNVFGTWYAAESAIASQVETFVLISTDKAVRPSSVMGATKRLAELVLQGLANQKTTTRLCIVRFGNVLDSSGSVVPLFREQIRRGGPITVTHPEAERYLMTIPEAAQLVIQASALAQGGDVFLLDMGTPVRIMDLAKRMVRLAGLEVCDATHPEGDIEIRFTGLRSGEKLREELLIGAEDVPTQHPMIRRAKEQALPWPLVQQYLEQLDDASHHFDYARVRTLLQAAIPEYTPDGQIEDWVWQASKKRSRSA